MDRPATSPRPATTRAAVPVWWIVCAREVRDLWIGGKALALVLIYTILLGIYGYLFASNSELQLLPLKQMVLEIVKAAVFVGMFVCLVIGADSFSGERERATLEGLLLTPTSRRQIVVGKFLAAVSMWPAALVIAIPYWVVLSKGDPALGQALLWGPIMGTLLAPAFAGIGMLVSALCNSNKTSMLVSLAVYLLLILPSQFSGLATVTVSTQATERSNLLQMLNPIGASARLLHDSIMGNAGPDQLWLWLVTPIVFPLIVLAVLFAYVAPGLRLEGGVRRFQPNQRQARPRAAQLQQGRPLPPLDPAIPVLRSGDNGQHAGSEAAKRRAAFADEADIKRGPGLLAWWLVCRRELVDLWRGGRALILLLVYTLVIGTSTYLMVSASQLDLTPPKEMVWATLQTCIYVGVFMGVLIGADMISGARERGALETLLLTPARRTQIVLGKFLASMSPWPAAMAVTFPCLMVVAQGDPILLPSIRWVAFVGSLLVIGFTGLGMLVSFWSNTNRTSLFISVTIYLLFLLPSLLPGQAQKGLVGKFFQRSNPMAAADEFLEKVVVNNRSMHDYGSWLKGPVVFPIIVIVLLFVYAAPRLRLQAGGRSLFRLHRDRHARASTIDGRVQPWEPIT